MDINTFLNADWTTFFLLLFGIGGSIIAIYEGFKKICDIFGIEFKSVKQKQNDHELLHNTITRIEEVNNNSVEHDARLEEKIDLVITSVSQISNNVNALSNTVNILNERSIADNNATIENLHKVISEKCKYYIEELDGIPFDEYDWFFRIADCYTACGGNHGLQDKVKYCKENLKILKDNGNSGQS